MEKKRIGKKESVNKREVEKKNPVSAKEESRKQDAVSKKETSATKKEVIKEKNVPVGESSYFKEQNALSEEQNVLQEPLESMVEQKRSTAGRVIGAIFESIWTIIKLAVILVVVTAISGIVLSRDMLIRGQDRTRQCLDAMVTSNTVTAKMAEEKKLAQQWISRVEQEKITLETDDKSILVARKIAVYDNSNKWAVVLHGYNGSMEDVYDLAMHYSENGYNVLLPDLRSSGESEGAFPGMGWLDRLDVINWIDVLLEENPSAQVVIHGVDMGADTALMLSGEPVKSSVKAIVAEGAYTSAWDVMKKEYKVRHTSLPTFPFLNMMNPVMKLWAGYSLKEADAVKQVKANASIPVLLIYGGKDTYTDEKMATELEGAIAASHKRITIASGMHGDCRFAEPDTYYNEVFDFADTYVK